MLAEKLQLESNDLEIMDTLSHKRVLIVGLGKTGLSCARYLSEHGIEVAVTDSRAHPPALDELQEAYPDIAIFVGGFSVEAFERATCLIVSPGISLREPLIAEARAHGAEIVGDIELFSRNANAPVIAITGSNGKSTVTSLLGEMATAAGLDVRVGGNIGVPALDLLHDPKPDLYILELSSFQLETTESLNACAAAILNISEDHMDRYQDINDYTAAKSKVYYGTGSLIVNLDDDAVMATVKLIRQGRELLGFTKNKPADNQFGICIKEQQEYLCYGTEPLIPVSDLKIKGKHNVVNALAALALGKEANIPLEGMLTALKQFPGLAHRSQWIAEKGGVIGVCFLPQFVAKKNATVEHILDHLDHFVNLVGSEHIGLGPDFIDYCLEVMGGALKGKAYDSGETLKYPKDAEDTTSKHNSSNAITWL